MTNTIYVRYIIYFHISALYELSMVIHLEGGNRMKITIKVLLLLYSEPLYTASKEAKVLSKTINASLFLYTSLNIFFEGSCSHNIIMLF